ncbi:hypothetical protein [Pseudonocardia sp. ICBG1293]|uniref:hypothetical protein n=1 Tax=Pseudonocardia sp. ICBG1293 TaxID=2844382 RepID=UPI001CCAD044|nr:hypothetical protein [Pseudonocardia sp. ICBG1293]
MSGQMEQDVPLLGIGREQTQAWTQTALAVANLLRQRRMELDQRAWSLERAAARASQQYSIDSDPRVRAMAAADEAAFRAAAEAGVEGVEYRTSDEAQFGWTVHTTMGPMPADSPSGTRGAWGLHGYGSYGDKSLSIFVVVPDRETAVQLRDEVIRGQQRTLKDLGSLGAYGHQRAEHARTEVREVPEQLRVRMAHSLVQAWPDDPDLVRSVLTPAQLDDGTLSFREVDRLAALLRGMEDRGHEMEEVFGTLLTDELREFHAQNPDGLAQKLYSQAVALRDRVHVVDSDPIDPAVARHVEEALRTGLDSAGIEPSTIYDASAYPRLYAQLCDLRSDGHDVAALLSDLPGEPISNAREPLSYLSVVVRNRAESATASEKNPESDREQAEAEVGLGRTGVDFSPAEWMMRTYLSPATVDAVIGCRTWPGLAKQVLGWKAEGVDFGPQLAQVPETRVQKAMFPAAYVKTIVRHGVDLEESVRARVSVEEEIEEQDRAYAERMEALSELGEPALPVTSPARDGVPETPFVIRELDPTNAVEREQLEMSRGAGTVADDHYIEAILHSDDPGQTWLELNGTSPSEAPTAQIETAPAAADQKQPQPGPTEPGPSSVVPEPAHDQIGRAELERAVAQAEHDDVPTAGALRADLAHRPPEASTSRPSPEAKPTAPSAPGPAPVRAPNQAPRRLR